MSGELDIRGGGAIAVDTATLGAAADGFFRLANALEEIRMLVGRATLQLFAASQIAWLTSSQIDAGLGRALLTAADDARDIAADLHEARAVYELVELRAARASAIADGDSTGAFDRRIAAIVREHPDAHLVALRDQTEREVSWPSALAEQALVPGLDPVSAMPSIAALYLAAQGLRATGFGTIERDAQLHGPMEPVRTMPMEVRHTTGGAAAPTNLAAAAARIPAGDDASRVRVERYTMADGSRQFAVYVTGMKAYGGSEPFDMASNSQLYTGARSASFESAMSALRQSGAEPGDTVHAFGHSQGAMIAARLAVEGEFDTRTLVSFGSPVDADVGPDTLSVTLRHTDDPVAALAGGGHHGAVGSPGSFVAERTADPTSGVDLDAHGLDRYTETAAMLDDSTDPRMTAVRELFATLEGAASVDATDYSAVRG